MKKNSKILTGILSLGLLTMGVLTVQADSYGHKISGSVPGLNNSERDGYQDKDISNKDGYLMIYNISGPNKMDGRAETGVGGVGAGTGPWVRLSYDNKGYLLGNSIKNDKKIAVRLSSDLTTYLPITYSGTFQGN